MNRIINLKRIPIVTRTKDTEERGYTIVATYMNGYGDEYDAVLDIGTDNDIIENLIDMFNEKCKLHVTSDSYYKFVKKVEGWITGDLNRYLYDNLRKSALENLIKHYHYLYYLVPVDSPEHDKYLRLGSNYHKLWMDEFGHPMHQNL